MNKDLMQKSKKIQALEESLSRMEKDKTDQNIRQK